MIIFIYNNKLLLSVRIAYVSSFYNGHLFFVKRISLREGTTETGNASMANLFGTSGAGGVRRVLAGCGGDY